MKLAARLFLLLLLAGPSFGADLVLRYAAMERLIAEQLFTQDGRRYVRGTAADKCKFAYLEAPHIGADNGRLKVSAKFSGRSAVDVFGRCVGLGDSFDLTILAAPVARKGAIALDSVTVSTVKDSYYIRRVKAALAQSFGKELKIEVADQAKKLLEQPNEKATFKQELTDFSLTGVQVTGDALVLVVEFRLVVK
jgi:hypothetical protein